MCLHCSARVCRSDDQRRSQHRRDETEPDWHADYGGLSLGLCSSILVGWFLVACSPGGSSGSDPLLSEITASSFTSEFVRIYCDAEACCNKLGRKYDRTQCERAAQFFLPSLETKPAAEAAGQRLEFYPDLARRCLVELAESRSRCDYSLNVNNSLVATDPTMTPLVCDVAYNYHFPLETECSLLCDYTQGPQATCLQSECLKYELRDLGGSCVYPDRCDPAKALRCDPDTNECEPRLGVGESCSLHTDCMPELYCGGSPQRCTVRTEAGAICSNINECAVGHLCNLRATPATCVPHHSIGEPCAPGDCCGHVCEHACRNATCVSLNPMTFCEGI